MLPVSFCSGMINNRENAKGETQNAKPYESKNCLCFAFGGSSFAFFCCALCSLSSVVSSGVYRLLFGFADDPHKLKSAAAGTFGLVHQFVGGVYEGLK